MEELAGVVGAVAEARSVEALVGAVHLLCRVALHEQVHRHDTRRLADNEGEERQSLVQFGRVLSVPLSQDSATF